jgi:ADP-heptose:LPS heptosyltransferase
VIEAMRAEARDLCGRLSLRALTGLLHRCSVMVGNDSGPVHLAEAVGAATVAVYWCGNLITAGPLTRARHRPIISWELICPACGVDCTVYRCDHPDSFVAGVPVDEVREAALDLLATSSVGALAGSPR